MNNLTSFQPNQNQIDATILISTDIVSLETYGTTLSEVVFPATMSNTAFDIQKSYDNGATYRDVFNRQGLKLSITVVNGSAKLDPSDGYNLSGMLRLKGAIVEVAARALILVTKPL